MWALKRKQAFIFSCAARTEDAHKRLVHAAFSNWSGLQPRGSDKLFEDFISNYESVIVTITPSGITY